MLGSLARWLRILGYDVEYAGDMEDEALLRRAAASRRILLTRDLELYRKASRRMVEACLVAGGSRAEVLRRLAERFNLQLKVNPEASRCPACNSPLKPASRSQVEDLLPAGVLKRRRKFWRCTGCGKIYWRGSHWDKIRETLKEASRRRREP